MLASSPLSTIQPQASLLTTNRPDILEPALAARPGRIDQAMEIPLPDRACRKRLFDLYGQGLALQLTRLDQLIDRTEGVSAAFIRELIRKAALFAADERQELVVEDRHVEEALSELVLEGGELTKRLLGRGRRSSRRCNSAAQSTGPRHSGTSAP